MAVFFILCGFLDVLSFSAVPSTATFAQNAFCIRLTQPFYCGLSDSAQNKSHTNKVQSAELDNATARILYHCSVGRGLAPAVSVEFMAVFGGGSKPPPYGDLEFIALPNIIENPTKRMCSARPYCSVSSKILQNCSVL